MTATSKTSDCEVAIEHRSERRRDRRNPYGTRSILELQRVTLEIAFVPVAVLLQRHEVGETAEVVVSELKKGT